MQLSATVSLLPEARGGPFLLWGGLEDACRKAAALGYDAVELFVPSAQAVDASELKGLLEKHSLRLAAIGTGAGKVLHDYTLTSPDQEVREKAVAFVSDIIALVSEFGASTIIGSIKGGVHDSQSKEEALGLAEQGLRVLGQRCEEQGTSLFIEPLNRYETNLINRLEEGAELLERIGLPNVLLLADLFHMNIEERSITEALRKSKDVIGHVHLVDTNRRPAGLGHLDLPAVARTLHEIGYDGYLSVEALPWPDEDTAAQVAIRNYQCAFAHEQHSKG